ncbi:MAG TPA: hypothetical protein VFS55_00400 [Dokdonella sp.]|nr:hypothetical protein [Dokdonella sp.]
MKLHPWLVLLAVSTASAQSSWVSWRVPVHAEIDVAPGEMQRMPLLPLGTTLAHSDGGIGYSPGFIIAGGARMDPDAPSPGTLTPYVTKVADSDGHIIWRWQPYENSAVEGTIRQMATLYDGHGDVVVIGYTRADGVDRSLLAMIDYQTGATVWRVDGEPGTRGYGLAVDPGGDISATFYGSHRQYAAHYDLDGAPLWSISIPDADDAWDDFRIVHSGTFAFIAGHYLQPLPVAESGVQVALADPGDAQFIERYPAVGNSAPIAFDALDLIQAVLLNADGVLRRIDVTGSTRWSQLQGSTLPAIVQALDATADSGGLYAAGDVDDGNGRAAEIDRLSVGTGVSEWHTTFAAEAPRTDSASKALRSGGSNLLYTWTSEGAALPRRMHATQIDASSYDVMWQVDFGSPDPLNENEPIDIRRAPNNSVFVLALTNEASAESTATLYKFTGSFTDDIFVNGLDL